MARSTLTLEFRKAVEEHGVDYRTLKRMVDNSLEYAFADEATKARLKSELATAFAAFERSAVAGSSRPGQRDPGTP